ncbi:hypothetical protein [Escherichia coli]|uniref:hypothetical protein n=1 Tax=Escherichia coli TaxID=562 RepID=UPI0022283B64|nr:hypothetical protein [Escherichia coli]MCW3308283.1 hypothetical protein [Escherichia coli]
MPDGCSGIWIRAGAAVTGTFFLLLHDVAMGTDYQVADILASQHDCKQRRGSQLPVNLKTCP